MTVLQRLSLRNVDPLLLGSGQAAREAPWRSMNWALDLWKIPFSLPVKGDKRVQVLRQLSLNSATILMNVSSERRMHLLPTRHKFTTCSDHTLTLLHSFMRPHCVALLLSGLESPWLPSLPWPAVSRAHSRRQASAKGRWAPKTKGKLHPGMRESLTDSTIGCMGFITDETGCGEESRVKTNICWTPTTHQALLHARWHWTDWG